MDFEFEFNTISMHPVFVSRRYWTMTPLSLGPCKGTADSLLTFHLLTEMCFLLLIILQFILFWVICLYICLCSTCVFCVFSGQNMLNPLDLELNWCKSPCRAVNQSLLQEQQVPLTTEPSTQPLLIILKSYF